MLKVVRQNEYYICDGTKEVVWVYAVYPIHAFVDRPYSTVRWCHNEEKKCIGRDGKEYRYYFPFNDTPLQFFKQSFRKLNRIERILYIKETKDNK